jgi:hypothetical protein
MNPYTVIGFNTVTTKIISIHVMARNSQHAFYVAALANPKTTLISSLDRHISEGSGISFSGESLVEAITVLEQEDVFNFKEEESPIVSTVLADFEIQDWQEDAVIKDKFRFVIEQAPNTKQVYFRVYPSVIDELSTEVEIRGLCGAIEIQNGNPAISIGTDEFDLPIHMISDIYKGLYLYVDGDVKQGNKRFESLDKKVSVDSTFFELDSRNELSNARREIADKAFMDYDFDEDIIKDTGGWECSDGRWDRTVFFEGQDDEPSRKGQFSVMFYKNTLLISEMHSN